MASSILENVKEEVTCPICLELMTEPVSTDCGHTFCKPCITANYESREHEQGVSHCPVCRVPYQFENLRPSRQVANIVQGLRELTLSPKVDHCDLHGEKLLLFCKEDEKVICWLCERSQQHRGHNVVLMQEAAQECREKLYLVLEKLTKDEKECETWKAHIEQERTSWKRQIQGEIESVQTAFKQMRATLDSEEEIQLQKLKTEEEGILNGLAESERELTQQSQLVRELISDVQHRLQGSVMSMLQDMKDTVERSRLLTVKQPRTFPKEQRITFQAPDLKGILQSHQAPVTLTLSHYPSGCFSVSSKPKRKPHQSSGFSFLSTTQGTVRNSTSQVNTHYRNNTPFNFSFPH